MFSTEVTLQPVHRAICLFFAALIVSSGLTLGYVGAQSLERNAPVTFETLRV